MNSDLRALIFSFTPVAQLQMWDPRLRIAITEAPTSERFLASQQLPTSPLFSYENFRNIILARYPGSEVSQILAHYNKEANLIPDGENKAKMLPIEIFTHIALAHGELGFFGHWHFSVLSCLLLAVRNRNHELLEYYMQFALFAEEDEFYVQVIVREAVLLDDVKMVALLLKCKIYGLILTSVKPQSIGMLKLLLQYTPEYNIAYLIGYANGKGWDIKSDLLTTELKKADSTGYYPYGRNYAVGQWVAGARSLPEEEEELEYLANWAILNLNSNIFPALIAAKKTPFTLTEGFFGDESSNSKIITKAMVKNIDKHIENILEYVVDTNERKLFLTYCEIIGRKVIAVNPADYTYDVNTTYDELFDALGLVEYEDRFSSIISEVMYDNKTRRDINLVFAGETMKLLSRGEDKFAEALAEPRFSEIESIVGLDPMFIMTILARLGGDESEDFPDKLEGLPYSWFLAEQFINLVPENNGKYLDSKTSFSSFDVITPKTVKEALMDAKSEIMAAEEKQKADVEEMMKFAKGRIDIEEIMKFVNEKMRLERMPTIVKVPRKI